MNLWIGGNFFMEHVDSENRRRKLTKSLKPSWVFAIALGSSVGWGAFILPGDWIAQSGPVGAMIGLLIGAIIMMIIASSYGVMIKKDRKSTRLNSSHVSI